MKLSFQGKLVDNVCRQLEICTLRKKIVFRAKNRTLKNLYPNHELETFPIHNTFLIRSMVILMTVIGGCSIMKCINT